jgi:hypothetical protein
MSNPSQDIFASIEHPRDGALNSIPIVGRLSLLNSQQNAP